MVAVKNVEAVTRAGKFLRPLGVRHNCVQETLEAERAAGAEHQQLKMQALSAEFTATQLEEVRSAVWPQSN